MNDHEERRAAEMAQMAAKANETLSTPACRENLLVQAKWRRLKYETYIAAGFEPGQALYLCVQP